MKNITRKTKIGKALETNEKVAKVLFNAGMGCIGCSLAGSETIEQGLSAHGLTNKEINDLVKEMKK
jgi:hybrid cluster-associated redox disulfide protein